MDTTVEMAKCREAAFQLTNDHAPAFLSCVHRDVFVERMATVLLAARADALREFTSGWDEPEECYIASGLEQEVQARRSRGL